jgi:uncharacterized protein
MLELRPACENCGVSLPPNSVDAMICFFECTFCTSCVTSVLANVCPNCGGGFCPRPIRPATRWKDDNYLGAWPATIRKLVNPVDPAFHRRFAESIQAIAPEHR